MPVRIQALKSGKAANQKTNTTRIIYTQTTNNSNHDIIMINVKPCRTSFILESLVQVNHISLAGHDEYH